MKNDCDPLSLTMARRHFLLRAVGGGLGLGLLTGCPGNQGSGPGGQKPASGVDGQKAATEIDRKQVATVLRVGGALLLRLPIPHPAVRVVGLLLQVTALALRCDFLWQNGNEQVFAPATHPLSQPQSKQLLEGRPLVAQNQAGESLNARVLTSDSALKLDGHGAMFGVRYRCPGLVRRTELWPVAQRVAAVLNILRIPWQGRALPNGTTFLIYGNCPTWQTVSTPLEAQARLWVAELLYSRCQAELVLA